MCEKTNTSSSSIPPKTKTTTFDIDSDKAIKCIESKIKFKLPSTGVHRPYLLRSSKKTSLHYKVYAMPKPLTNHHGGKPNIRLRPRIVKPNPRTSSLLVNLEWRKNGSFLRPYKPHALALSSFTQDETLNLLRLIST